jgi:hypothetical protein
MLKALDAAWNWMRLKKTYASQIVVPVQLEQRQFWSYEGLSFNLVDSVPLQPSRIY